MVKSVRWLKHHLFTLQELFSFRHPHIASTRLQVCTCLVPLEIEKWRNASLCTSQFQNRPSPPPGQSPGIWLALSSVQWGIWPKMRPAWWGIWLSRQNVCQRSWSKGIFQFFDSAGEPRSRVIALVDSTWVFLLLSFYIVLSWISRILLVY